MKKPTYERLYRRARSYRRRNFFFTLLLLAGLAAFGFAVDARLREYEATQPRYAVDAVAERIAEGDYEALYASEDPALFPEESREQYMDWAASRLAGKAITWREAREPDEALLGFKLYADGEEFAYLTLRRSEETTAHGYEQWEPASLATSLVSPVTYTVQAQETSTVTVDGELLGEESVIQSGIPSRWDDHLPEGAPSQQECVYAFTRCFSEPVISVVDIDGQPQALTGEDGQLVALRNFDDEEFADLAPRAQEVLKAVADYTVGLRTLGQARAYTVKDSPVYDDLYLYSLWNSATASRSQIDDFTCGEFLRLSDDMFVCSVTADFTCTIKRQNDTVYKLAYDMYFQKNGGRWALYDLATR